MSNETFDVVVIGGGPGGYVAAIRAAQLGFKTAVIEKRKTLGGTCLNVGCIPSKALLESSEMVHFSQHKAAKHGIVLGDVKIDLSAMMKRKEGIVRQLVTGVAYLMKKNKITHYTGTGTLNGRDGEMTKINVGLEAGVQEITAKNVILATGSEPVELPFLKFDGKRILSSTEVLELSEIPKHLVVIGGGVIGLEMASVWSRLGSKVTVVEFLDRIANGFDRGISEEFKKILTKQGIEFMLSTKCTGAVASGNGLTVSVESREGGEKKTLECDYVLVSTGRRPYTAALGLDSVGITPNKQGQVEIDDHFKTSVKGIYAIGDLVRGAMLAHKAEEEGVACAETIAGQAGHVNYHAIPGVVYTWPELAAVGYTEEECKEKGIPYKIGTFPFNVNGRAKAMEELDGFVKIISHEKTDRMLGMHILGARAGDLIHEGVAVLEFGGSAEDVARSSHAHPSLAEVIKEAAMAVDKRAIHM